MKDRMTALLALVALGAPDVEAVAPINNLHVNAHFSAASLKEPWSASMTRADGSTAFVLSFSPELDTAKNVVGVDLVLHRPDACPDDDNLLAPTGNWHGLQAYMFPAEDFLKGPSETVMGPKRAIVVKRLGLVVEIRVINAAVKQVMPDHHSLDSLDLQIDVTPSRK